MLKRIKSLLIFVFVCVFCGSLVSCNKNNETSSSSSTSIKDQFDCITVSEAIDIATTAGEDGTSESYYVYGKVKEITNYLYGEMYITDGTKDLYVYGVKGEDDTFFDKLDDAPEKGDEVVLYGPLQVFKDKPELKKSTLMAVEHAEKEPIDLTQYTSLTVADTRTKEKGTKVTLEGVVAYVTKTTGNKPNGFYLVDETGSTFVYSEKDAASVKVGEKIKLIGETNLFVNPKEQDSANKFNYKGAFQITDTTILENDKGSNEFNKTWVKESTVKDMVESKDYTNMSGNIYKVNAFIHKDAQDGYTNYIINDLDDKTGSYVYTANNGSDFAYLDEFDGKICTVYLSVINYKANKSKVTPRLIPVLVKNENFVFPETAACDYTLDYHIIDQFKKIYNVNPEQEMITSYSDTKLGFENVKVSYTSSNNDVFTFDDINGKLLLNAHNDGKVKINVKAQYKSYVSTREIEVSFIEVDISNAVTVKEVVDANVNSQLMVKGIVTSSLVNKSGFYISDDTGVIAVLVDDDLLSEFAIGDEVVIEGKRINTGKSDYSGKEKDVFGISAFECDKLILNNQGNHSYNDSIVVKDKTIDELYSADAKKDFTTTIYEVRCKVVLPEGSYANYKLQSLIDSEKGIQLYCSNKDQYKMMEKYIDKEVTVHFTLCNWNGKNFYRGCLVAVVDGNNRDINDLNFR